MASDENESDTQEYFGFYRDSNTSITSDSKHSKSSKKDKREKTGYQHFTKSSSEEEIINKKTNSLSDKKSKSLFKFTNVKEKTPKYRGKNGSQPTSSKDVKPFLALPANFFRLPLQEALKYDSHDDGVPLPTFVRNCIDYIEEHGEVARKEGIYKKSVAKALLEKVKARYVETGFVDWVEHSRPRSLAPTLLRHYIKHLPLPLIPLCVELSLMQQVGILRERQQTIIGNHKNDNKNKLVDDIQTPLNFIKTTLNEKLPISHWYMLAYLLSHFLHLFAFESENKFNLSNCVHLFAPLLRLHPKLLKVLLLHYKELFPGLVIKRLSKPIEGEADSADNIDMPNCLSDLEKELASQESALKELHAKMQQPTIQLSHHKNVEKCLTLKQDCAAAIVDRGKKIKHAQSFTKGSSGPFYSKYGKKSQQNDVIPTHEIVAAKAPKELAVKKLEDELWEVQRRVTQLKRKIRLCKQAEYPKMPEELLEPGKILEPRKMGPFQVLAGKFLEPMKASFPAQGQASSLTDVSLIIPLNENDLQFVEQSFDEQLTSNQGTEGDLIVDEKSKNVVKAVEDVADKVDLNGEKNVQAKRASDCSAISSINLTDFEDSISSYSSPDQANDERSMGDRPPDHFVNFSLPNDWENSFADNNTNAGFDVCSDDDFKDDVAFCENPLEDSSILNEAFTRLVELILPLKEHQEKTPLKVIPLTVPIVTLLAYLIQEKLLLEEGEKLKDQVESDTKILKQQTKRLREKLLLSRLKQESANLKRCDLQKISLGCGIDENVDLNHEELIPLVSKDDKGCNTVKDLERCNHVLEKTNSDIIDNLYYQNNEIMGAKIKIFLMSLLTFLSDDRNIVSGSWNNYTFKIIGIAYKNYFPRHVMATKRDVLAIDIFNAR